MKNTCGFFIYHSPSNSMLFGHVTNHNEWSIPKGKQEAGETILSAALRELSEEANIPEEFVAKCKVYGLKPQKYSHNKKRLNVFLVICDTLPKNIFCISKFTDSHGNEYPEFDKHRWFTLKQIDSMRIPIHYTQYNAYLEAKEIILNEVGMNTDL